MKMCVESLAGDIKKITLTGSLDIAGAGEIDMQLSAVCGGARQVLIDMAAVDFLASIGIRSLVMNAKAVRNHGGKMLIVAPQPLVEKVLQTSGIHELIPIFATEAEAIAELQVA